MRRSDFDFELPTHLIAEHPARPRSAARLLCLRADACEDRSVGELPALLRAGDVLVVNDTRVIPARLYARRPSGGRVEVLVERVLDGQHARAYLRPSRALAPGMRLALPDADGAIVIGARDDDLWMLDWDGEGTWEALLGRAGHVPLPPYIRRPDDAADCADYQTVYARVPGAVAAPTAGLHFDAPLLEAVRAAGVEIMPITLHVGAGTFAPVRVDDLAAHRMHAERYAIPAETAARIGAARRAGGRVVAVGTTVVRALESAWDEAAGAPRAGEGETRLFITPGYRFRALDVLLTNFHLPRSTLLMLVCAFGGRERVLRAYAHAVASGYRFYSYGDAMLIESGAAW